MTILPKKKAEEESDSDEEASAGCSHESSPHAAASHPAHSAPNSPEEVVTYHGPDGFFHRRYDLSSSSGESSPEMPSLSKRTSYRLSPVATASGLQGKKPLDASPGYNSAEEYDGSRRPYVDAEAERQFENALRKERGFVIKKMRPDGACLFRAVADQIYGDQEMHGIVRANCMDYMLKNAEFFSQYVTDEDFEHYVSRKRLDQCYGNNIEMQAMAELYNRPIEVFQYSIEPINIFFGVYKTDNVPLRLSYHGSIHYNSVVDPYNATIGVGLGLAGFKPGLADKMQVGEAQRESENIHIEKTMLEDKKRSTDWDATYDAIEEAVTRESYLTWLRENEKREQPGKLAGSQPSSSACRGNSPPMASTSSSTTSHVGGGVSLVTSKKAAVPSSNSNRGGVSSPPTTSTSSGSLGDRSTNSGKTTTDSSNKSRSSQPGRVGANDGTNSPAKSSSHRSSVHGVGIEGGRRTTPPSVTEQQQQQQQLHHQRHHNQSHHHHRHHHHGGARHQHHRYHHHHHDQGGSVISPGSAPGSMGNSATPSSRNSPYYSPKEFRNSSSRAGGSRYSPKESSRGVNNNGGRRSLGRFSPHKSPRDPQHAGVNLSPNLSPPPLQSRSSPGSPTSPHLSQSPPSSSENSPTPQFHRRSPSMLRRHPQSLLSASIPNLNGSSGNLPASATSPTLSHPAIFNPGGLGRHTPSPAHTHNVVNANTVSSLLGGGVNAGGGSDSRGGSPSPPRSGSQSPLHTLSFEDGRVLSQLPYEYSSFLDLPPSALGLSEWEDDRILAAVLAASQQEYIDGLRQTRDPNAEDH